MARCGSSLLICIPFVIAFFRNLFGFLVLVPLLMRGGIGDVQNQAVWVSYDTGGHQLGVDAVLVYGALADTAGGCDSA